MQRAGLFPCSPRRIARNMEECNNCSGDQTNDTKSSQTDHNCVQSTAASKDSIFKMDCDPDVDTWKLQHVKNWSSNDVLHWIASVAETHNFPYEAVNAQAFSANCPRLDSSTVTDFIQMDANYGRILYEALQQHNEDISKKALEVEQTIKKEPGTLSTYVTLSTRTENTQNCLLSSYYQREVRSSTDPYQFLVDPWDSKHETSSSSSDEESNCDKYDNKCKNKRSPGRPAGGKTRRGKSERKTERVWEFIRDLLLDPRYCPSLICWENHDDGVFRFVKSDEVAKIWGSRKSNDTMTYDKLSRAMRYHYKRETFLPVIGRRLVYKFGPSAKGWRTDNPNFRNDR